MTVEEEEVVPPEEGQVTTISPKKKKKSRKSVITAVSVPTTSDETEEKKEKKTTKKKEKSTGEKSSSSSSPTGEKKKEKKEKEKKEKKEKDKDKKEKEKKGSSSSKKEKSKKSSSSSKKKTSSSSKTKTSSSSSAAAAVEGGGEGTTSTASDDEFNTSQGSIFSTDDDNEEDFIGGGNGDDAEPELEEEVDADLLQPIPTPNNPKMEKINLLLEQPNLEKLTMYVDPANTNIRMIREYLQEMYYKEHKLPRKEQRTLLYKRRPIFDLPPPSINIEKKSNTTNGDVEDDVDYDDINVLDSYTLADYGIVDDKSKIELSKMIVYVIAPTTKQSMMINNVDPMYDVIFDMKKLALQDGYPIERLKLLHKEANNKEIKDDKNEVTFYDCGIKDHHTLILEWPYITLFIKVPKNMNVTDGEDDKGDERDFMILDLELQAEMEQVHKIREFVFAETGIPKQYHKLLATSTQCPPNKSGGKAKKEPKQIPLDDYKKLIADYKLQDNDVIELLPMTLKMNYIQPHGAGNKIVETKFYPNDTVGYVKNAIAKGIQDVDGIPKTNVSIKFHDKDVTKYNSKTLYELDVVDGSQFNIEKERYVLPLSRYGGLYFKEFGKNSRRRTAIRPPARPSDSLPACRLVRLMTQNFVFILIF